jgi:hypothetical protein
MRGSFAALVAVTLSLSVLGCGSSSSSSASQVAAASGASSCDDSGYYLIIKATGEHDEIYDCAFQSGSGLLHAKCVTYENGIANDSTEAVRIVFSTALGTQKPTCLSG